MQHSAAAAPASASTSTAPTPSTSSSSALSITKEFKPYYPPTTVLQLVKLQSMASSRSAASAGLEGAAGGRKELSETRVEGLRQLACGYIERVGARLGFPRRTIATAQTLYHRFHLHFPLKDYDYHDVSLSTLLVSSKLEDTLKKLREIQIAGWQVTDMLEGGTGAGEGDSVAQEAHRPTLIAIERLVLQTICFNFNLHRSPLPAATKSTVSTGETVGRDVFSWTIRIARAVSASKQYTFLAHLLAIDMHRTLVPLSYPPHTIALACLYLASHLLPPSPSPLISLPYSDYSSLESDILDISQVLLNLYILLLPISSSSYGTDSPRDSESTGVPSLSRSTAGAGSTGEREKHVMQTGTPAALCWTLVNGEWERGGGRKGEELVGIKIKLREEAKKGNIGTVGKRWREGEEEEQGGKRVVSVRYRF